MKVIVIIPAAGLGTRMAPMPSAMDAKTKKPHPSKQFNDLAGTPILIHTLRKFAAVDAISEIWIALRENEIEGFRERLAKETEVGGGTHERTQRCPEVTGRAIGFAQRIAPDAPRNVSRCY